MGVKLDPASMEVHQLVSATYGNAFFYLCQQLTWRFIIVIWRKSIDVPPK